MHSVEKSKLLLRLSLLVGLILLLLPNVFQWVNDELIRQVGEWFGYKMLLTIPLILLLVIAYQCFSNRLDLLHKVSENSNKNNSGEEHHKPTETEITKNKECLLRNLAEDKKVFLQSFLKIKYKVHSNYQSEYYCQGASFPWHIEFTASSCL